MPENRQMGLKQLQLLDLSITFTFIINFGHFTKDVFKFATSDTIMKILAFRSNKFHNETDGFRVSLDTYMFCFDHSKNSNI